MKPKIAGWSQRYVTALKAHLQQGPRASVRTARGLGAQALAAGAQTLDLAKLHEQTLIGHVLPGCPPRRRAALIKQAGIFFTEAIILDRNPTGDSRESAVRLNRIVETLSERTVELAASNFELQQEIIQRKEAEAALKKSELHSSRLLSQSARLQEQLRHLSRKILSAQEEERKEISRELHDVVAQTLTGINVQLSALKTEAATNTRTLGRNISRTQRVVDKSVKIIHQFARELRPPVLDDLGLIPALHSFMKGFTARTGVRASLRAAAAVEKVDAGTRTVLFRVAQEALTNVGRHARASCVEVCIERTSTRICMKIKDDGKSFLVERTMLSRGYKRLGLLGMRERLEMVDGTFDVDSAPGKGTTIVARIPISKVVRRSAGRKFATI